MVGVPQLTTPTQWTNADEAPCINRATTNTATDLPTENMKVEMARAISPSMYVARRESLLSDRWPAMAVEEASK